MSELPHRRDGMPLGERWQFFREACLPPDAPEIVVDKCREAFVAGIGELFRYLLEISFDAEENWDRWIARVTSEVLALVANETRRARGLPPDG